MSLPLAVRQRFAQGWSSELGTPTRELTRGRQDLRNNLYDRLFDPSRPKRRILSLISFQPQALSTDMPLLRPANRSDHCSCSNQQRTTAQAKIVVTKSKEGDQKRSLDQCTCLATLMLFPKGLLSEIVARFVNRITK